MQGLCSFVLFALFGVALGEVVNFEPCPNTAGSCNIHEVRISPCPEAASNQACKIRRGGSAQIQFDYTPDFNSDTLEGRVFWASEIDLPLVGMDTDGCKFTQCPVVKGEKRTYSFSLPISRKFPVGSYDIKWRLFGSNNQQQECCFTSYIKLTK